MKMGAVDWGAARRRSEVVFSLGRRPRNETGPGHPSDPATVTTARAGSSQGNVTTRPVSVATPDGPAAADTGRVVTLPCVLPARAVVTVAWSAGCTGPVSFQVRLRYTNR